MTKDTEGREVLKDLRREIDHIDNQIVALIARRVDVVRRVGQVKFHHGIAARLPYRMTEVKDRNTKAARKLGINDALIAQLYTLIIEDAILVEERVKEHEKTNSGVFI